MPTDTRTSELVINVLSKQDYDNISNPDPNQLYLVPEDEKANVDANNFTEAGTTYLSGLGMPNYTHYDIVPILASESKYTAPANGWFFCFGRSSSNTVNANINMFYSNNTVFNARTICWVNNASFSGVYLPVKSGDEIQINYSTYITFTTSGDGLVFIYAEGNPTSVNP